MDHKELIEHLHRVVEHKRNIIDRCTNRCCNFGNVLCEAATAIETLLEERDTAVEDLRGMCWCCVHGKKYENGLPWSKATTCEHMRELGAVARSGGKCKCSHWQWRGPQKEGGGDG